MNLDLAGFRTYPKPFYSHTDRPSVDPELIIHMLILGYCYGIRSERRLCEEIHLNLAYRWCYHLGIHDRAPDHFTFSKNRHGRFRQSDALRELFESVLRRCIVEGLVGGEGFATDASIVRADAQRPRAVPSTQHIECPGQPLRGRRSIQHRQESLKTLAALHGINPRTVAK